MLLQPVALHKRRQNVSVAHRANQAGYATRLNITLIECHSNTIVHTVESTLIQLEFTLCKSAPAHLNDERVSWSLA